MSRELSSKGVNLIATFEGCRLTSYKDIGGVWTIGYGHTKGVTKGMKITKTQAKELLKEDCNKFVNHVNRYMKTYNFNQNQFDALVSFAFNIGNINQLTNNGRRTIKEISSKMLEYCNCNGKRVQGLVNRRIAEKELFDTKVKLKTINTIAKEVIEGKWGNGEERKQKLTSSGYDYNEVQKKVNQLLK